jgi:hypothetical protein
MSRTVDFKARPRLSDYEDTGMSSPRRVHYVGDIVQSLLRANAVRTPNRDIIRRRTDPVIREAWAEWRVNASYAGASPDTLPIDPPRWFVREELGTAFEHGPSLYATLDTLAKHNRRALVQLGREAPCKVTFPIHTTYNYCKLRRNYAPRLKNM